VNRNLPFGVFLGPMDDQRPMCSVHGLIPPTFGFLIESVFFFREKCVFFSVKCAWIYATYFGIFFLLFKGFCGGRRGVFCFREKEGRGKKG